MAMALALDITNPQRRGACPTLDAPMQTGDGLLARLRVEGGRLSPKQLAEVAALARMHGNGLLEITARGNLQVRGLTPASAPRFAEAVWQILPIATGLVIDVSPIAGEDPHEKADPRLLAAAIRAGVGAFEHRLGPKVSVVIDGGGQVSLEGLKADIRLVAQGDGVWAVAVGKDAPAAMSAESAVAAAVSALSAMASIGLDARAADIGSSVRLSTAQAPSPSRGGLGWGAIRLELKNGHTTRITLPFGAMDADTLTSLARAAREAGVETIRLAPDHSLLLDNASASLVAFAQTLGFITTTDDPRLRVSACIGSAGCASGHLPARQVGARLAHTVPPDQHLHVSGCAKGCAHPRPAAMTLVGRADGIGLVFAGRAGDTPQHILDEAAVLAALQDRR